jgi:hypothetical protein
MAKHVIFCAVIFLLCCIPIIGFASTPAPHKCHSLMCLYPRCATIDFEFAQDKKLLLFILDFNDFMCMNCLESLLSFCHSIPPHILEENAWGILTIESAIRKSGLRDSVRIAKTKLRGFVKANRIKFPIFVDERQVFRQSERKGSSVVLFDGTNNILKEYIFPLSKDNSAEILRILSGF